MALLIFTLATASPGQLNAPLQRAEVASGTVRNIQTQVFNSFLRKGQID